MGMSVLSVNVDIVVDDAFVCLVAVEYVLDLVSSSDKLNISPVIQPINRKSSFNSYP